MMTYYKKCRIYGVVSVAFSVLFAFSEFAVAEPFPYSMARQWLVYNRQNVQSAES